MRLYPVKERAAFRVAVYVLLAAWAVTLAGIGVAYRREPPIPAKVTAHAASRTYTATRKAARSFTGYRRGFSAS